MDAPDIVAALDAAYAAGIIDGEGCIHINKLRPSNIRQKTPFYRVRVSVAMCDREVCAWLQQRWPGTLTRVDMAKYNPNARPSFRWILMSRKAIGFLKVIYPHLKIKKRQAALAFRLQELNLGNSSPILRGPGGCFAKGNGQQSPERLATLEALRQQISDINQGVA